MIPPDRYNLFLNGLKQRIDSARVRAALSVNQELIALYWEIGGEILRKEEDEGWGAKVITRLSRDLKRDYPEMAGFSRSNLKYMRGFAKAWPDFQIGQQPIGQIPWGHNISLLEKAKDTNERRWYAKETIVNGWSRKDLI
ncbi:MAG: DUF1016 N-terminal domain-containing protein, partial [Cyanobacteria bacterium J06553_1]